MNVESLLAIAAALYVLRGVFCVLAWVDFERRTYFAIAGPTPVGRHIGTVVVVLLVLLLWPLYGRVRHANNLDKRRSSS